MCKRQNSGYNATIINADQAYDLKTIILPLLHKICVLSIQWHWCQEAK